MKNINILGKTTIYSLSNILTALLPLILLPILTRTLNPSEYGEVNIFTIMMSIINALVGLNIQGSINICYSTKHSVYFRNYVGNSLWILISSATLIFFTILIFIHKLSLITGISTCWLILLSPLSACNFLIQLRLGLWLMESKPFAYTGLQLICATLNFGFSIIFVLLSISTNTNARILAQALALIIGGTISFISLLKDKRINMSFNFYYIKEMLNFGVPLLPHILGGLILTFIDRFVAIKQLGISEAGTYMVATQLGIGIALLADAFNKAFVPWLYETLLLNNLEKKRKIVLGTYLYFIIALIIAGTLSTIAPLFIHVIIGRNYSKITTAFCWINLGQAFSGMYLMVTNYIFYSKKIITLSYITLFASLVSFSVSWALAPKLGINGIAMGFTIGMFVKFIFTWFVAALVCPMPWFKYQLNT